MQGAFTNSHPPAGLASAPRGRVTSPIGTGSLALHQVTADSGSPTFGAHTLPPCPAGSAFCPLHAPLARELRFRQWEGRLHETRVPKARRSDAEQCQPYWVILRYQVIKQPDPVAPGRRVGVRSVSSAHLVCRAGSDKCRRRPGLQKNCPGGDATRRAYRCPRETTGTRRARPHTGWDRTDAKRVFRSAAAGLNSSETQILVPQSPPLSAE